MVCWKILFELDFVYVCSSTSSLVSIHVINIYKLSTSANKKLSSPEPKIQSVLGFGEIEIDLTKRWNSLYCLYSRSAAQKGGPHVGGKKKNLQKTWHETPPQLPKRWVLGEV